MPSDPALRAALERQAVVLAPAAARLRACSAHPPIAPQDWGGPAARGFDALEGELRAAIREADAAVGDLLHWTRLAIGRVDG